MAYVYSAIHVIDLAASAYYRSHKTVKCRYYLTFLKKLLPF
jgi:ACT domain-containing protein